MFFQLDEINDGILRSFWKAFLLNKKIQLLFVEVGKKYLPNGRAMGRISEAHSGSHPQAAGVMIQFHLVDVNDLASVKEDHVNRLFCSLREVIQKWLCFFSEIELTE
jgi:hypothetical protein